jgi:aminopeptidase N
LANDQVKEPWLSEGLACWSAQLYGRQAGIIQSPSQHISDHLAWSLTAFSNHSEYMSAIYNGGQLFWDEIENKAGQVKLYHGLHEYVKQYSGKVASTKDLFETLQKCGVDSKLLIHTWPGKPPIN